MSRVSSPSARVQSSCGIDPSRHAPTQRVINRLLDDLRVQLGSGRRSWWDIQRTACLENQWVLFSYDGLIAQLADKVPEAKQIVGAIYEATTDRLRLQFSEGSSVEVRIAP